MLKASRFLRPGSIQSLTLFNKSPSFKSPLIKGLERSSLVRGVSSLSKQNGGFSPFSNECLSGEIEKALLNSTLDQLAPGMDLSGLDEVHLGIDATKVEHNEPKHPNPSIGQLHTDANAFSSLIRANADAGDPLGCDSADMRTAKARSQYAWVTCESEFEKYVLQAQNTAYFYVERDPESDDPQYRFGFALSRPIAEGYQLFNHTIDEHWFRFQPKTIVSSTDSLEDAFKRADLLVSMMVEDGWLKHVLKKDAEWRYKPCSIRQLNMLLRMQWAYNLKCREEIWGDKLDFFGDALVMNNGQVCNLLNALLHSHFAPADDWLYGERSVMEQDADVRPAQLVALSRPNPVRPSELCNNFYEGHMDWATAVGVRARRSQFA